MPMSRCLMPYQTLVNYSFLVSLMILCKHVVSSPSITSFRRHWLRANLIQCEPIAISLCQDLPYNQTGFPNPLNDQNQQAARVGLHGFLLLIESQCSPYGRFFLCLLYTPACNEEYSLVLPPCRKVCERVQEDCEDTMNSFGFKWPEFLSCKRFPTSGLCTGPKMGTDRLTTHSSHFSEAEKRTFPQTTSSQDTTTTTNDNNNNTKQHQHQLLCPPELRTPDKLNYKLIIGSFIIPDCGAPCIGMFFTESQVQFARLFNGILSSFALIPCFFVTVTFLINIQRFQYPQRVVLFQSFCYSLVSLNYYLAAFFYRDTVACIDMAPLSCPNQTCQLVSLVRQGTKNGICTLSFILVYFFSMAASVWSVIFGLVWFLAATKKWCSEAIEAKYLYYHSISWGLPILQTSILLNYGYIGGDVLSGVCQTGLFNTTVLIASLLLPHTLYFLVSLIFRLTAFISLIRISKTNGRIRDLLRKFRFFSVVSATCVSITISCLFYESLYKDQWLSTWYSRISNATEQDTLPSPDHPQQPSFVVFLLKYTVLYIHALLPAMFLANSKTFLTWTEICPDRAPP
uniref:Frizzled-4 n=1 Tax=Octopus bimaculoides TaxID=37653 RepID=A0A0L8I188_OCTBM